ncbi:MAG: hypothetical protein P1V20_03350 [Verrucomicrobiales bacterium]|nr:hypothetical protein [Verrucomicrobiales bacterium]
MEPLDYRSSQYVIEAQSTLAEGEWPTSTRQGELTQLKWRFGESGSPLHEIEMYDSAGQDQRTILLEDFPEKLSVENQRVRREIDSSDVLVFLFDLGTFYETTNQSELNENAWLFKTFLTRPAWKGKKRIVVATKYAIYRENFDAFDGVTVDVIREALPKNYSIAHLIEENPSIDYLAVTSVETETILDDTGKPRRVPQKTLNPGGLFYFVNTLVAALRDLPPPLSKAKTQTETEQNVEHSDDPQEKMSIGDILSMAFLGILIIYGVLQIGGCVLGI